MRTINLYIKQIFDIIYIIIGCGVLLPLLILIALFIKLTSKGPIIFKQERIGKNGSVFNMYKFRTMVVNAEKTGKGLRVDDNNDPRITKVGKLLRASSLDELPQVWNIIIGDMSLVGPRPPATYYPYNGYTNYPEWAKPRFQMRPGMTGLAQITVRNSVTWDERFLIDLEYIEKFNLWLDFKIIFLSFLKVFKRENIYANNLSELKIQEVIINEFTNKEYK